MSHSYAETLQGVAVISRYVQGGMEVYQGN